MASSRDEAVTVGKSIGAAMVRMWILKVSAEINRTAVATGTPRVLGEEEFSYWESVSEELPENKRISIRR